MSNKKSNESFKRKSDLTNLPPAKRFLQKWINQNSQISDQSKKISSNQSSKITDFFPPRSINRVSNCEKKTVNKENLNSNVKFNFFKPPQSSVIELDERLENNSGCDILVNKYHDLIDFEHFNEVQIGCMSLVFESNDSFLINASAGSGKSTVLEFAIIKLIDELKADEFKVILIVPFKKMANEKLDKMKKFSKYGLKCNLLTFNSNYDAGLIENCSILICTPDRLEMLTHNSRDFYLLSKNLKLVLIDDVQLLAGNYLEAFICRLKLDCKSTGNNIRYISAGNNIGDSDSICRFFGENTNTIKFGDRSRMVPLEKIVIGYNCPDNYNDFYFDKIINKNLISLLNRYQKGRQILIICATRLIAEETAEILKKGNFKKFVSDVKEMVELSNKINVDKLKDCFLNGVAYHHGGLPTADKKIVEQSFNKNLTSILICTSVNVGLNVQSNVVVIKGTFRCAKPKIIQLDSNEISQMIAIAGRQQKVNNANNSSNLIGLKNQSIKATAIIITKNSNKATYEAMLDDTTNRPLESKLQINLCDFINVEIVLNHLKSFNDVLDYVKSTYFYRRLLVNPKFYNVSENSNIDEVLERLIENDLKDLDLHKVIKYNSDSSIEKTEIGLIMSSNHVSFDTLKRFGKINDTTIGSLLHHLCECKELNGQSVLRKEEKSALTELNKDNNLRFPIRNKSKDKIQDLNQKINCLIQAELGQKIDNSTTNKQQLNNFKSDACFYIKIAKQLASPLVDYFYLQNPRKLFSTFKSAILLAKSLKAGIWHDSKIITKQFDKIGPVYAAKLTEAGYINFEKLRTAISSDIELVCNRNPNFGDEFLKQVNKVPEYELKVTQTECENIGLFQAELMISIELKNHFHKPEGTSWLIIGDEEDSLLLTKKIPVSMFDTIDRTLQFEFECSKVKTGLIHVCLINDAIVGADCLLDFRPKYSNVVSN